MKAIERIQQQKQNYLNSIESAIIHEVKKILRTHKNLVEFNDIMGSYWFVDKNGEKVDLISSKCSKSTGWNYVYYPTYKYFNRLLDLYAIESNFCIGQTITLE